MRTGWPDTLLALLVGLAGFFLVVGPGPLDPTNIAWLADADAATNYLGWAYYRAGPWVWPVAANPDYGMGIAGSIMMADANPLLAIPFKALSPILPQPFQYFGWWLLACFLLQALFGVLIASRLTPHREQRLAIGALLLFAPFFLIRIATPAVFHMTLAGQWQLLAAFWLYLSPDLRGRSGWWSALLAVAMLSHPYLLVLVAAIWLADLLRALLAAEEPLGRLLVGAVTALAVAYFTAQLSGVLWLQGAPGGGDTRVATMSAEWGFGIYKANLLSAIDAGGWSMILPDIGTRPEQIEGFAYLGLGVLGLAVVALVGWRRLLPHLRIERQHMPLVIALLGCLLFALSDQVEIGGYGLHIPWPSSMIGIGNMFRSTGRFIWPIAYAAIFLITWAVSREWRRPVASVLLAVAALVQIADTSAGWKAYAQTFAKQGRQWSTALRSPFWDQAAKRYRAVGLIVPVNRSPYYRDVSAWAQAHGMKSELVYLARYDVQAMEQLRAARVRQYVDGSFARDTLWVTDGLTPAQLAKLKRRPGDLLTTVDSVTVYAPGFGPFTSLRR